MPDRASLLRQQGVSAEVVPKPRLLDLFCGAGGCSVGYERAGFEVVGVDIKDRPEYPFEFHKADAMTFPLDGFDAVHASPPCQAWTHGGKIGHRGRDDHPRLIEPIRERLQESGLHYVIENVAGARDELVNPVMLCGSMFGLMVERHRYFEITFPVLLPACQHGVWTVKQFPGTPRFDGSRPLSRIVNPMSKDCSHEDFAAAMGIDWMAKRGFRPTDELREAIPPAFTELLGTYLMAAVQLVPATEAEAADAA